jgi:hypothetical protein
MSEPRLTLNAEEERLGVYEHTSGRRRPFPSSQVLASSVETESSRTPCPLIRDYLQSVGKEDLLQTSKVEDTSSSPRGTQESPSNPDEQRTSTAIKIDDRQQSTLSKRQHDRFLELSLLTSKQSVWKESSRKEFQSLQKLVNKEQELYRSCLHEFWNQHRDRLLEGLQGGPATVFANLATFDSHSSNWKQSVLEKLPHHHCFASTCCQIISLPTTKAEYSMDLDSFATETVGLDATPASTRLGIVRTFPCAGEKIMISDSSTTFDYAALRDDPRALALAEHYKVDLVTTADTLATLLEDPANTRWMIPLSSDDSNFAILEVPLPVSYTSPRACLTKGLEEGIYQWMASRTDSSTEDDNPVFTYTLWKLPPSRTKRLTLLVRSRIRLLDDSANALKIHAHIEYFPERGQEIPSATEKALWLLDNILHPSSTILVLRMDPRTCQVLDCDQVSRAHALVDGTQVGSVADLWQNMIRVLYAVPTIETGHHLLCLVVPAAAARELSSSQCSVSVHKAQGERQLAEELSLQVSIDAPSLQSCFRSWKWSAERAPYTFPPPN